MSYDYQWGALVRDRAPYDPTRTVKLIRREDGGWNIHDMNTGDKLGEMQPTYEMEIAKPLHQRGFLNITAAFLRTVVFSLVGMVLGFALYVLWRHLFR